MDNKTTKDLRVKRTHKLLHYALFELMEKQPFENITVKQICDLAMVHRTTFYTHFQDKFDLLSSSIRQIAEDEFKGFVEVSLSPSDNFKELLSIAMKHKKLFSQLLSEERDSLRSLLRRDIGIGMKKYLVEHFSIEDISIDMQIKVEAFIGAVLGVLTWWIENNMPIDKEELYKKMDIFSEWTFGK